MRIKFVQRLQDIVKAIGPVFNSQSLTKTRMFKSSSEAAAFLSKAHTRGLITRQKRNSVGKGPRFNYSLKTAAPAVSASPASTIEAPMAVRERAIKFYYEECLNNAIRIESLNDRLAYADAVTQFSPTV